MFQATSSQGLGPVQISRMNFDVNNQICDSLQESLDELDEDSKKNMNSYAFNFKTLIELQTKQTCSSGGECFEYDSSQAEYARQMATIIKTPLNILIVDDVSFNLRGLRMLLMQYNNVKSIEEAFNGQLAVNMVKEKI